MEIHEKATNQELNFEKLRSSINLCCEVCLWDTSDAMMEPDSLKCITNAEYVLEGYLCHDKTVREDINSNTGKAMPEFPGYTGDAKPALPVIKITAVTHRKNRSKKIRRRKLICQLV